MPEYIEHMDEDFLGNKINIGDTVIFEAPGYRCFTIGKVSTKAPKSCQIEYVNNWNYPTTGRKEVVRQAYDQIIKHPATDMVEIRHSEWKQVVFDDGTKSCKCCMACGMFVEPKYNYKYCPGCGAKMDGKVD